MRELAQPEARGYVRSQSERFTWGIVDVVLGLIMLPFGIWMLAIEGMVDAIAAVFDR
jgi:hypothetical protein